MTHLLAYDHVLGRRPEPPGRLQGRLRQGRRLPRAAHVLRLRRRRHHGPRVRLDRADPAAAPGGARRQAGGRGGRPVRQPAAPRDRHRLEHGRVRRPQRGLHQPWPAPGRAGRGDAPPVDRGRRELHRHLPHHRRRQHQPAAVARRCRSGSAARHPSCSNGAPGSATGSCRSAARTSPGRSSTTIRRHPGGSRPVDGRLRHPGPGPVRRRRRPSAGAPTASKGRDAGATHLAVATHNAGQTDVDGHLDRDPPVPRRRTG